MTIVEEVDRSGDQTAAALESGTKTYSGIATPDIVPIRKDDYTPTNYGPSGYLVLEEKQVFNSEII